MKQNQFIAWTDIRHYVFRFVFCYLVFYFLLLSDIYVSFFPFVEGIHKPFKYISDTYVGLINDLFIHRHYEPGIYTGVGDTSWFFMACLVYLGTSLLLAFIWTLIDKRRHNNTLFIFLHTYARYYLAFILMAYGLAKLFETQFPEPPPDYLIQPLGNIDSHMLMWTFMGASKSYNYFAGLLETITGLLLLFRRSVVLGALLSLAIFTQVLLLDIGYDTLVKSLVAHLLLISSFILSPAVQSLWNFFLTKQNASLPTLLKLGVKPQFRWLVYGAKAILIGLVVFGLLQQQARIRDDAARPYYGGIDGIYETTEFFLNKQLLPPLTTDNRRWRRMAISKFGYMTVQFMNDSTAQYGLQVDTATKWLVLQEWNDNAFQSKLKYSMVSPTEYVLEGTFMHDSLKIMSQKRSIAALPLLKDKGKIKWVWW